MKKIKSFIKELWHVLRLPEMLILPGNLAFFIILSIIPIITLIGVIASFLSLSTGSFIEFISGSLPKAVVDILVPFIDGSILNPTSFIFIVVGFYAASNGADSLITASNTLYKCQNKNYIFRRIKALFMTFWMLILFIFILVFLAFGSLILKSLLNFSIGNFILNNYAVITMLKLIIAFLFIYLTIKIIYTMAPDITIKSKYVNRGAILATIVIMIITSGYSFYVTNIAHYDMLYGSLASLAILMFLIYFISYIIVLGIAINHNYYNLDKIIPDKK
ncbi:MAG: YihY/virulence factor BrkB family protein [Bacilli bacterium]